MSDSAGKDKSSESDTPNHTTTPTTFTNEEVFSSEKSTMDFVTLKGIQTRTSIDPKDFPAFIMKELLDNALDFLVKSYRGGNGERNNKGESQPVINVTSSWIPITPDTDIDMDTVKTHQQHQQQYNSSIRLLNIKVSNFNPINKPVFTANKVRSIFDFTGSYSSKKNQFRITRGALGDALKEIVCIPYAMAIENCGLDKWDKPLIIRDITYNNSKHNNSERIEIENQVRLFVDKPKQEVRFHIIESNKKITTVDYTNYTIGARTNNDTSVVESLSSSKIELELNIPVLSINVNNIEDVYEQMFDSVLFRTIILNPHVAFNTYVSEFKEKEDRYNNNKMIKSIFFENKNTYFPQDTRYQIRYYYN